MTAAAHRLGPYIVATDGRAGSDHALALANKLAMRSGAGLVIVSVLAPTNVIVPSPHEGTSAPAPGANRVEQRRALIASQVARVLGARTTWPVELLLDQVEPAIARVALERDAPLIVTGYVHHAPVSRFLRRETPLGIAAAGEIPVLAVPAGMTHLPRVVMVAVGDGEAAHGYARQRMLFADALAVHLVHVKPHDLRTHDPALRDEDTQSDRAGRAALVEVERLLEVPPDVPVISQVLAGPRIDRLLDAAAEVNADLLVVGMSPQSWRSALIGSGAGTRLYRGAACAVLLVPMCDRVSDAAGSVEISTDSTHWPDQLAAFVQRNRVRSAVLEVDDRSHGMRTLASGYTVIGAELDPRRNVISLSLASLNGGPAHFTHRIENPTVIAFERRDTGSDHGIIIGNEAGQCLLTFL